ncbi:MAG: helix-turn-helix transcriptional regulator [Planctomycetota bacterium]
MFPYGTVRSVKQLGGLVRRRRKEAGVRQADAAALAGVGVRFLSELERGKETAEVGKVLQVLERLGLELSIAPRGAGDKGGDRVTGPRDG